MEARMGVTKAIDTASGPDAGFQLGGLMIRSPDALTENHVLLGIGCMGNPQLKMVSQNTIRGNSATHVTRIDKNSIKMRLRRTGPTIELSYLSDEGTWVVLRKYERPEWQKELQVGIAAYAYVPGSGPNRKPDILVRAEGFEIRTSKP